MTKKVTEKKVIAVLNYPNGIEDTIQYGDDIHDSMFPKARYAALLPKLLLLDGALTNLHKAQIACTTTPPTGTVDDRDAKMIIYKDILLDIKIDVQKLADADKPNARTSIEEAGMQVRGDGVRGKRKNKAKNGPEEGQALLEAEGGGPHNWRYSIDNQVTWILVPGTTDGHAVINKLPVGAKVYFQTAPILTKGREAPWSDPFSLRIN